MRNLPSQSMWFSGLEVCFNHCTKTRVVTILNTSVPTSSQRRSITMEKNNRARVLTRRDHRRGNVAAYATIDDRNARNEATTEMRPR